MDSLRRTFSDIISRYAKKSLFASKPCYTEAVVQRMYMARNDDEFTLYPGDVIRNIVRKQGPWWKGELRGKKGCFNEKYVVFLPQEKRQLNGSSKSNKGMSKIYAKVLFSYIPINEDEFKLEVGDIIEVCEKIEDGWWSGILGDQFGVFPSNYVVLLDDTDFISDGGDSDSVSSEKGDAVILKSANEKLPLNITSEDDTDNIPCEKEIFDVVKRTSPKLTHPTITRAKGPNRKPPSSNHRIVPSIVKQVIARVEAFSITNVTEENSCADREKKGESLNDSFKHTTQASKTKVVQPNVFTELKQKIRDLENEIDDLKEELALLQKNYASKTEHQKLKIEVDCLREMIVTHRQYCSKLMSDLMCEVDEEKKLRSIVQIQLDRIMKLLTCTCSKSDLMPEDTPWKDTSV